MTSYHGGKKRIGKKLAEAIYNESLLQEDLCDFTIKGYCEPFSGMLGVYQHIPELFGEHSPKLKYKASDINKSVIMMWKEAQHDWKPPNKKISKKKFNQLKYDGKFSADKGFIGHMYTYRGVFFDGYFAHNMSKINHNARNVVTIAEKLKNVDFSSGDYKKFSRIKNHIIYCDPPYQDTQQRFYIGNQYKNRLEFDSELFWDWCRMMSKNNIVFVSEYKAPRDFKLLWKDSKSEEKLFVKFLKC
jgi:DNA adenine methylase